MIRLIRTVPLLLVFAVVAVIVYAVEAARHSPNRAKEVLIKVFLALTGVLAGFFLLASLYALAESNTAVFDVAFAFFLAAAIGLAVTLVCRHVFLVHWPEYRKKPMRATRLGGWRELLSRLMAFARRR